MILGPFAKPDTRPEEGAANLQTALGKAFADAYADFPAASGVFPLTQFNFTRYGPAGAVGTVTMNQEILREMMRALSAASGTAAPSPRLTLDETASANGGVTPAAAARITAWLISLRTVPIADVGSYVLDFSNGSYRY